MQGIILKDDARYGYTEDYLRAQGHTFDEPDSAAAAMAVAQRMDFIIFPFKGDPDRSLYHDGFFAALKAGTMLFSGVRNSYIEEKAAAYGLVYHVMLEDRATQIRNAVPTSEGIIAYLIANCEHTIASSRILIIGYGTCGRDLARRLVALGAKVSALVRNREKESLAYVDAVTPLYLEELAASRFEAIINTVPGRVLSGEILYSSTGTLLVDIASEPYGFEIALAKRLNPKSALLAGIPGKYAVRTAGIILGEYVQSILKRRKQDDECNRR